MKKVVVDNGDDNAKDVTEVSSADLIGKKLTLNNFGEEDKLKLGNQTLGYKALQKSVPDGVTVNFQENATQRLIEEMSIDSSPII